MSNIFVLPRAQTLRFVRTDNYPIGDLRKNQSFDNRLIMDENWQAVQYDQEYVMKFNPGDPILIQVTTNYDPKFIFITLNNQDETVDLNGNFTRSLLFSYTDSSGNVVYNYLLDQRLITFNGFKYVSITAIDPKKPKMYFRSESFEFNNYVYLPYFEWQKSDRSGIYWDDQGLTKFGIRAEIHQKYSPTSESSVYEGFNFQPETLFSVPKLNNELNGDPLPRFMVERLELCFKHEYSWINGILYSANGASAKIGQIERTNLYDFNLIVLQKNYEDYSVLQPTEGAVIEDTGFIDYDNADFTDYDDVIFDGQI